MVAPVAQWRTVGPIRRTSSAESVSVDVAAHGVGGDPVDRVELTIHGSPSRTVTISSPSLRTPNYSTVPMKPMWCYGATLPVAELPYGIVRISAIAVSAAGSVTALPYSLVVINDSASDSSDSRDSKRVIYVNAATGNDANDGSALEPVRTIHKGILLCRRNPNGSSSSTLDMSCGGATVVCTGAFSGFNAGSYDQTRWCTGDVDWVTLVATPGTTLSRFSPGTFTEPNDYIFCRGADGQGKCRVKFVGWTFLGVGPTAIPTGSTEIWLWADNCTQQSNYYTPGKDWSVKYLIDDGPPLNSTVPCKTFLTNFTKRACSRGVGGPTLAHDFTVSGYIAIAMESTSFEASPGYCNGLIEKQRYYSPSIAGLLYTAAPAGSLVLTVPSAGVVRIEQVATLTQNGNPAWPVSIATQLQEIVSSTWWSVQLYGFGLPAGSDRFQVLSTGVGVNGNPFVTIACSTLSAQSSPANAGMRTVRASNGTDWSELIHPDLMQWNSDCSDTIHESIAARDIESSQGYFAGGHVLTRCVLWNVTDGGNGLRNNFADGALLQSVLMEHCTFSGVLDFTAGAPSTSCVFRDVVAGSASAMPAGATRCHFITGPTFGALASSGPWFENSPAQSPWSFKPLQANLDTGTPDLSPAQWAWPGSVGVTRGCLSNVGSYNWLSPSGAAASLIAAGGGSSSFAPAALVGAALVAAGSSSASLSGSGRFVSGLIGTASSSHILTAAVLRTVAAALDAAGSSSASLTAGTFRNSGLLGVGGSTSTFSAHTPSVQNARLQAAATSAAVLTPTKVSTYGAVVAKVEEKKAMKQRIYNALVAAVKAGPFYPCKVDPKTGQIAIDFSTKVKPTASIVAEVSSSWQAASDYRRASGISEISAWLWTAKLSFDREVACEAFEISVSDTGIKVPPQIGLDSSRTLVVRLVDSSYAHPPQQSPSNGTVVEFTFEVDTDLLRK